MRISDCKNRRGAGSSEKDKTTALGWDKERVQRTGLKSKKKRMKKIE
jgi:hypothetical protein